MLVGPFIWDTSRAEILGHPYLLTLVIGSRKAFHSRG
jgi:hypothetical protein